MVKVISIICDSESYKFLDVDIICNEVKVIVEHFRDLLLTNNCGIYHLKEEYEILFDHINRYVSNLLQKNAGQLFFAFLMTWESLFYYTF